MTGQDGLPAGDPIHELVTERVTIDERARQENRRTRAQKFRGSTDKAAPRRRFIVGHIVYRDGLRRALGGTQKCLRDIVDMNKTHWNAARSGPRTQPSLEPRGQFAEQAAFPSIHFANS